MIKVLKMTNTDGNENSYLVEAFADTKQEVTSGATFIGFPTNATMEMGSFLYTANLEIAILKSTGDWNWVE